MHSRCKVVVMLICCALLFSGLMPIVKARDEQHFLDYSEDNFKVVFISGNLTAAVTHDWPRIVFQHTTDPFSPTFEVGFPRMYLFNDSNQDGVFAMPELVYVSHLDQNHVAWNVTTVEFHNDTVAGEYASFRMNATLALYEGAANETIAVSDWANITFWFRISERNVTFTNSRGPYVVLGKTELSLNFTLDILKPTNLTGLAVEQLLQGGGSTFMFLLRQQGSHSQIIEQFVSGRVDETAFGANFTNRFVMTSLPVQDISYTKDDGTVQAFYHFDSVPTMNIGGSPWQVPMNCSYFTTGTGLILHSSYMISNNTGTIFQEASVGIVESGFVGSVSDWLKGHVWSIVLATGALIAVVAVAVYTARFFRRRYQPDEPGTDPPEDKKK